MTTPHIPKDELSDMLGTKQTAAQIDILKKWRCPYKINAASRVIVGRRCIELVLAGVDPASSGQVAVGWQLPIDKIG